MAANVAEKELTREELYERVWSTPMRHLAAEFGLSDVGLAKLCERHKIPRPSRGHWAKVERGKRVQQRPLAPIDDKSLQTIRFHECHISNGAGAKKLAADPEIAALIEAELAPENRISVQQNLSGAEAIVTATRESLSGRDADDYGRVSRRCDFRDTCFHVCVSKQNIRRSLLLLHAIVRAFRERGYVIGQSDDKQKQPFAEVLGRRFKLSIWEPAKRRTRILSKQEREEKAKYPWSVRDYEYVPTGNLEIHLDRDSFSSLARVADTKRVRLEERLNQLIVNMLRTVDRERIQAEEARLAAVEAEALKRAAVGQEVRARSDGVREGRLLSLVPRWEDALRIRRFIDAIRVEAMHRLGEIDESSEVGRWLQWADGYLASVDPLSDSRELPTYSLTPREFEQLTKECESDWCSWSKSFRPRQPR